MFAANATASVGFSYSTDPDSNGTVVTTYSEVLPDAPDFDGFFTSILDGETVSCCAVGSATRGAATVFSSASAGSTQSASVGGSAGPSHGASIAIKFTDGWTTIDNSFGLSAIDVTLEFDYSWSSFVSTAFTDSEYAEAATRVLTYVFLDDIFIDAIDLYDWQTTDSPGGLLGRSGAMTLDFIIGVGAIADIELFVAAQGFAQTSARVSEIPEPATLGLFGFGLVALGLAARRRISA